MGVRVRFETADGHSLSAYPGMDQVPRVGEELHRSYKKGDVYRITRVQWTGRNNVCCIVEQIEEDR